MRKLTEIVLRTPYNRRFYVSGIASEDAGNVIMTPGAPRLREPHPRSDKRSVTEVSAHWSEAGSLWVVDVTYGNGYAYIQRSEADAAPLALLPLDPAKTWPVYPLPGWAGLSWRDAAILWLCVVAAIACPAAIWLAATEIK